MMGDRGADLTRLLAKALILWDQRTQAGCCGALDRQLLERFPHHLAYDFEFEARQVSLTDVDRAWEQFPHAYPTLTDWYRALLPEAVIDWRKGEPRIVPRSISTWERLCAEFDADALLTFDLADRQRGTTFRCADFEKWRTVARIDDDKMSTLFRDGVSDLHVHVTGVRSPHYAWQELIAGEVNVETYRVIGMTYAGYGRDLRRDVDDAMSAWQALRRHAQLDPRDRAHLRPTADQWWRCWPAILSEERCMLSAAWSTAFASGSRHGVVRDLDVYLSQKHRFFGLVRGPTFASPPGLRYFDQQLFSSLKKRTAKVTREEYGTSPRLEMAPHGDACRYLLESEPLRRIELRIAPFERATDYLRFFERWYRLKQALKCKGIEIRYAVHFKRTRDRDNQHLPDVVRKLARLDRETAALRLALSDPDPKHRMWMSALSRIDVAGQERDTPLALFVKHLRLLRGDRCALRYLERIGADDPFARWLQCWKRLAARQEHIAPEGQRLGVTVHAGEDFDDLLAGLYQIGTALDALKLQPGDCIGHALALTADAATSGRLILRGIALDSLCWLFHFAGERGGTGIRGYASLRSLIGETAGRIYEDAPDDLRQASAEDHVWVWQHRVLPEGPSGAASDLRRRLLSHDGRLEVMHRRETAESMDRRRKLELLVKWAQRKLLNEVQDRGVIVEMNPSSNLRVSGVGAARESPTAKLYLALDRDNLLVCVNTDNPGVFTSCIENEYALLLESVAGRMTQAHALELLDRVRQIGMKEVFLGDHGPAYPPCEE